MGLVWNTYSCIPCVFHRIPRISGRIPTFQRSFGIRGIRIQHVGSPLSSFVMRVPGMRDARRNAQASDRSGRPTATAYLPCVNHRMWNKRRLALLARCLTARECKLSRTHIHRLSAVYARRLLQHHTECRIRSPRLAASCFMSVDRCSHADEFQLHVLAASYCLIRTARCGLSYSCSYLHLATRPAELQVTSVPTHNRHGHDTMQKEVHRIPLYLTT